MFKNRSHTTNETALTDLSEATLEVLGNVLPKRVTHSILQECNSRLKNAHVSGHTVKKNASFGEVTLVSVLTGACVQTD